MIRLILSAAVALGPSVVVAQSCADEIAGLFDGGPMDPFSRPPYVSTTVLHHPDGSETFTVEATWETPVRVKSVTPTSNIISIGSKSWTAPTPEGPWGGPNDTIPEDIEGFHRRQTEELMRNATEPSCPGTELLDGREVRKYVYRTVTDPNEWDSWFGGLYATFVDTETNLIVRLEISEGVASWAPEKSSDISVATFAYDPAIKIDPPQ